MEPKNFNAKNVITAIQVVASQADDTNKIKLAD